MFLHGNLLFWKEILLPIKIKLEQTGLPMNPSDLKNRIFKRKNLPLSICSDFIGN